MRFTYAPETLPAGAVRVQWVDGHGPINPDVESIVFYQGDLGIISPLACNVSICQKCITEYKKELNFPYLDEHEVFV